MLNLRIQHICLHKLEITLQNALRYHFALLSPAGVSEFDSENFLPLDAFSMTIFRTETNISDRLYNLGGSLGLKVVKFCSYRKALSTNLFKNLCCSY